MWQHWRLESKIVRLQEERWKRVETSLYKVLMKVVYSLDGYISSKLKPMGSLAKKSGTNSAALQIGEQDPVILNRTVHLC